MAITVRIGGAERAQCHRALMDTGAQVNIISQSLVKELGLEDDGKSFSRVTAINGSSLFIYGTHQIDIQVVDGNGVSKAQRESFHAADIQGEKIVLGYG